MPTRSALVALHSPRKQPHPPDAPAVPAEPAEPAPDRHTPHPRGCFNSGAKLVMLNAQKMVLIFCASDSFRNAVGSALSTPQPGRRKWNPVRTGRTTKPTSRIAGDTCKSLTTASDFGCTTIFQNRTCSAPPVKLSCVEHHAEHGHADGGGQAPHGDGDEQTAFELPAERARDHFSGRTWYPLTFLGAH